MNMSIISGRIVKDIWYKNQVAKITLAVKKEKIKKNDAKDVDFIPVTVLGARAVYVYNTLKKGDFVEVIGSINDGAYKDNNKDIKYGSYYVECEKIELIIPATPNAHSQKEDNNIVDKDILSIGTVVNFKDHELPF
ncbi:single-stranded DNA-binding protein [Bacillus paranthracis]|uniref:single-stranded DNA-binding protein n=1 Tax=Bacillus cereus group TaxID=86661 RepID=UPI001443E2A3|nr:single-stranded DNA-binding protein [Bacillus paranthracis]NKX25630.1 single-stranded DNA-binding protein [Bacillus paranthracis]